MSRQFEFFGFPKEKRASEFKLPGTTIYDIGETAGFADKDQKITLPSCVNFILLTIG